MMYRRIKASLLKFSGPITVIEYIKAWVKDCWYRSKFNWLPWTASINAVIGFMLIMYIVFASYDTKGKRLDCINSCKALHGVMIEVNQYGCICYANKQAIILSKGGK